MKAFHGMVYVALYDADHEPDLTDRVDNTLLGLPILSEEEVSQEIRKEALRK